MSTTRPTWWAAGVVVTALAASVVGCAGDSGDDRGDEATRTLTSAPADAREVDDPAETAGPDTPDRPDTVVPAGTLTPADADGLVWMREEEQLAHDVYTTLGGLWDLPVFENIAESEQRHIEATVAALDRFGMDDPAEGNAPGRFTDPTLQELHDRLVADGGTSVEDALAVGALIEELDIADLRARAAATDDPELDDLYARLERASRNHLRAFVSQLASRGIAYVPTELSPDDLVAIVSSDTERGRG